VERPDDALVLASGAAATLTASGPDRFAEIRAGADDLFDSGDVHAGTEAARPRLFGGFAFHDGGCDGDPVGAVPEARFVLPRVQVTFADNGTWLTVNAVGGDDADPDAVEARLATERDRLWGARDDGRPPAATGIAATRRTTSREAWRRSVEAAVDRIRGGDLQKVVLAQALEADLAAPFPRAATLDRLAEKYPDCHPLLLRARRRRERLLRRDPRARLVALRGRTVETDALAGTTGRGETPAEDEWLARELLDDAKNVHEHELVADTVREQLEPFAASISAGERRVRRLATVQHLHTPITAELNADRHVLDLVEALHRPPAVGGLPPDRARNDPRHGAVRPRVVRRAGRLDRRRRQRRVRGRDPVRGGDPRRATLFAGVGLVADSDPDREWDEVQLKYRPILDELEDGN